jgi:hypothetical protein
LGVWENTGTLAGGTAWEDDYFGMAVEYWIDAWFDSTQAQGRDHTGRTTIEETPTALKVGFDDDWKDGDYNDLEIRCSRRAALPDERRTDPSKARRG